MDEERFWSHALGAWIRDCVCGPSTIVPEETWRCVPNVPVKYSELCDGYVLNLLFFFIDPDSVDYNLLRSSPDGVVDGLERLKHFHRLLRNLHNFYKDKLSRVITMRASPDVLAIVKHPVPEVSAHELNKILVLLLGCAVQSDQKEHFIERIRCMRTDLQTAIVEEIQKVTEESSPASSSSTSCVVEVQSLDLTATDDNRFLTILEYLERVMQERDDYASGILEMAGRSDLDEVENGSTGTTTSSSSCNDECVGSGKVASYGETTRIYEMRSPSPNSERHASVEIAKLKYDVRKITNSLENERSVNGDLLEQLQQYEETIQKLKSERAEMFRLKQENDRLKDENDSYYSDLTELRNIKREFEMVKKERDNQQQVIKRNEQLQLEKDKIETMRRWLTDENERLQKDLEKMRQELEKRTLDCQELMKMHNQAATADKDHIDKLMSDKERLEQECKVHVKKIRDLEQRNCSLESESSLMHPDFHNESLQSQLEACNRSDLYDLELENRKLRSQLENSIVSEPGEMFELREQVAAAERLVQEKMAEIKKLANDFELVQEARTKAETRLNLALSEQDVLNQRLTDTQRQLSTVQVDLQCQRQDDSLQRRIKDLEADLASKEESLFCVTDEKKRVEGHLERSKTQQRESRIEADSLRDEVTRLEDLVASSERAKKVLETERQTLRVRVENLEDQCDRLTAQVSSTENFERRLANNEAQLAEKSHLITDLEADNRTIRAQMELESKKTHRLREDLVSEKARIADLLARLRSVCNTIVVNGGKLSAQKELLESDDALIDVIDDVIVSALNAARREADALRLQQQLQIAELDDLKKDIENLRRAESELTESDDKMKELLLENKSVKEQVAMLQERTRKLQMEESSRTAELQATKREIEELHTKNLMHSRHPAEIAKLQVQLRNSQLQEDLLREGNAELREQFEQMAKLKSDLEKKFHAMEATQNALIADYDRLQNLHQLLGADYDRAKFELMSVKQKLKQDRSTPDHSLLVRQERDEGHKLLREAEMEVTRLQRELDNFRRENCAMLRNTDERSDELRRLRMAEASQKSTINSLNGTIQQLNHVLSGKDMEIATLRRQVDMLRQYNGDENQSLIKQIELLLVKNQELHERTLNDKDTFHAIQRDLQEQLVTLRRNKEKLEEKIMDQYKSMDSRKVKEKQTFVKRAAKALMPNKSLSRKALRPPPPAILGSTTEDSSIDEANSANAPGTSSNGPTSCSSDFGTSSSPDYETFPIVKSQTVVCDDFVTNNRLRCRNALIGGSMRIPSSARTPLPGLRASIRTRVPMHVNTDDEIYSLAGSERGVDTNSPQPAGIRQTRSVSNAMTALTKPGTPTVTPKKPPPPPYPGRNSTPTSLSEFRPQETSTPKPNTPSSVNTGTPPAGGNTVSTPHRRTCSYYENVDLPPQPAAPPAEATSHSRSGSAVWFEYGCV